MLLSPEIYYFLLFYRKEYALKLCRSVNKPCRADRTMLKYCTNNYDVVNIINFNHYVLEARHISVLRI